MGQDQETYVWSPMPEVVLEGPGPDGQVMVLFMLALARAIQVDQRAEQALPWEAIAGLVTEQ